MEADDTPINIDVLVLNGLSALTMADLGSAIDRCERLAHDLQLEPKQGLPPTGADWLSEALLALGQVVRAHAHKRIAATLQQFRQANDRLDATVRDEAANIEAEIEAFLRDYPNNQSGD